MTKRELKPEMFGYDPERKQESTNPTRGMVQPGVRIEVLIENGEVKQTDGGNFNRYTFHGLGADRGGDITIETPYMLKPDSSWRIPPGGKGWVRPRKGDTVYMPDGTTRIYTTNGGKTEEVLKSPENRKISFSLDIRDFLK